MSEHRSTAGSATGGGGPEIARLLAAVESQWPSLRERGIACDRDSLISAAACGLVERVWRNSPVEEAHGSRNGPSDGEMMAESLDLYAVARNILDRDDRWPFLEFEDYVLELDRPWSGTSRIVKDMLFGHLGKFRQHVKDEVNRLSWIDEAAGRDAVLRFLCLMAVWSGDRHFGMPDWHRVVDHAVAHLSCPADPCWDERGYELASRRLPRRFIEQPAEFGAVLRRDPGSLGPEVLGDLIASGLFMWPRITCPVATERGQ